MQMLNCLREPKSIRKKKRGGDRQRDHGGMMKGERRKPVWGSAKTIGGGRPGRGRNTLSTETNLHQKG